jgi:hypothetical protein
MPMKLSVGICRKVGQPDYSSLGATCNVELESSSSLITDDLEAFHRQVQSAYSACRHAVESELARARDANGSATAPATDERRREVDNGPQPDAMAQRRNGNSQPARPVTEKQLGYIRQLAGQVKGIGARRLDTLATAMFGKPIGELTSLQASGVIDCLKGIKAGEINLQAALSSR